MFSLSFEYDEQYRKIENRTKYFNQTIKQISPNLKCSFCKEIMIEPLQTDCGCRFCKHCLDNYEKTEEIICPYCGSQISTKTFLRDRAIEKEIFGLEIRCLNKGCEYQCVFSELRNHLIICNYRLEQCDKCYELFPFNNKDNHLLFNCPKLMKPCQYCGLEMTIEDLGKEHTIIKGNGEKLCEKLKGKCPYNCDYLIYDSIKNHLQNCSNLPIKCPLSEIGCDIVASEKVITMHLNNDIFQHQILMMKEIKRLQIENVNLTQTVNKLTTLYNENLDKLDLFQNDTTQSITNIKLTIKNLKDIESTINETVSVVNGRGTWILRDFQTKHIKAKSGSEMQIISDPFYLNIPGYRMRLKVYPNGDGRALNNYLSVYFLIVQGEYDDQLSWPFKKKVTLSILSHKNPLPNIYVHMMPNDNESCYGKPVNKINTGAGQPEFCKLSELIDNDNYLHGGSLHITIKA